MTEAIERQLLELEWEERRSRRARSKPGFLAPLNKKIYGLIPPPMTRVLEDAFRAAFRLVFQQGSALIARTIAPEKLRAEAPVGSPTRESLTRLRRRARDGALANTTFATIEGGSLGLLGCGLPDIPVFLALLLKNIYEIALRHGFSYEGKGERVYILTLLSAALAPAEEQEARSLAVDDVAERLDLGLALYEEETETLNQAARSLAQAMLVSKFIQGYPLVGVAGGLVNNIIIRNISDYATRKYSKRFLLLLRAAETGNGENNQCNT
ncbi:MAG: EcsC family protein [Gracilibacteraceae bacterium]|jgi:hypothetical protein|nr:EcsC family protein [Gracilibacteraceae bacterium]